MLSLDEYARYSRQLLLPPPAFGGVDAQLALRQARVLVVGAGGLGCPAVTYLAAAGVGHLTVVDPDTVERSNLARQFLHTDAGAAQGTSKVDSIADALARINPHVRVQPVFDALSAANALPLVSDADIVLDCTDNPLTRYLISDAAVLARKPVVSGAAQGVEGQIVVLNKPLDNQPGTSNRGPCYRCLFPKAPRPEEVQNCSDAGVLGVITGLVGTLQALETIKILAGLGEDPYAPPTLLLVSPLSVSTAPFRTIKLRPRRNTSCRACGDHSQLPPSITPIASLEEEDYLSFCGLDQQGHASKAVPQIDAVHFAQAFQMSESDKQRSETAAELQKDAPTVVLPINSILVEPTSNGKPVAARSLPSASTQASRAPILIDVRPAHEFRIARLAGSTNVPLAKIRRTLQRARRERDKGGATAITGPSPDVQDLLDELGLDDRGITREVHVLCRRGNDSQEAVTMLTELFAPRTEAEIAPNPDDGGSDENKPPDIRFFNVTGGLHAYAKQIDPNFPVY